MTYDFVNNIGFWGIFRVIMMPDVLCTTEYAMSKSVQKLPLTQDSVRGLECKARFFL